MSGVKSGAPQVDIASDLASAESARQENALLAVIALMSAGRDITAYVSQICHHIVGNASVPLALRVRAYDIIKGSSLSDMDASRLSEGIACDLRLDATAANEAIQSAAFFALRLLPSHRLIGLMSDSDFVALVRQHLYTSPIPVRAASAQCIAMVMSFDTMMKLLTEQKDLKKMFENFVKNVANMLVHPAAELTLAAAQSLQSLLETMSKKVKAGYISLGKAKINATEPASHYSQATMLALSVSEDIVLTVDGMFAEMLPILHSLSLNSKRQVLRFLVSYLDAKVLIYSLNVFDHRPGEILGHQMDEVVNFFAECSASFDPSLVVESTKALLSLVKIDKSSASLYSQVPLSIQASIDSISALEGRYQHVAQQGLLDTFLSHMDALPPAQQVALFGKLPLMIATVPSSRQRVKAFVKLWYSVASYDWNLNSVINGIIEEKSDKSSSPASEIQHILLEKSMKDCVAGLPSKDPQRIEDTHVPHPRYQDPIFREEVVGSLLYVLLTHPGPITGLANSTCLGQTAANSALITAAGIQAAGSALDWLLTSKSSLQNTKPCLGWDRVVGVSTTGATVCVDLWLQLLLRCISVSSQLKERLKKLPDGPLNKGEEQDEKQSSGTETGEEEEPTSGISNLIPVLKRQSAVLEVEFQALLLQIAANWRALHPVVRPRAIWVCAFNLRFRSALDIAWNSLADALKSLLVEAEHVGSAGPTKYFTSVAEGSIKSFPVTDRKKCSMHDPFVAAAAGETEEIGVLVMERLANLLAKNHKGTLRGRLADIAKLLESLASMCISTGHLSPASYQRLERIKKLLAPVASSGKATAEDTTGRATTISVRHSTVSIVKGDKQTEKIEKTVVVDLDDEDFSTKFVSYPCTVPASPSLIHSNIVRRYQEFLGDLQSAIVSSDDPSGEDISNSQDVDANVGLPSLSTALEVLDTGSRKQNPWVEVTGIFSPFSLCFCHFLEPSSSTIRLRCRIENKTSEKISGLEVHLLMGGPIAMHRRPLVYKIRTLKALEFHEWEIPCRCLTFGWPVVQAVIALPVECPSAGQSLQPGAVRCKPYSVSPLELILKSNRPIYAAEFFQMWQTFPHRANAYVTPKGRGMRGVMMVLSAIESAGLACSSKVLLPVSGGIHAAYSGISWSGHTIALIVSTVTLPSAKSASLSSPQDVVLHFHFASDVAEVISPMHGHEHDLVSQLTRGRATPVGSPLSMSGIDDSATTEEKHHQDDSRFPSTFSFFKSMIAATDDGDESDDEFKMRKVALLHERENLTETFALTSAAVSTWKSLVQVSAKEA
ncbi:hypothetical protein M9435_002362 [Picochlorum sp. BPE23]|nr:hypothetical protein M9435_002362 [Picochlorum sp. BPE23]